MNKRTSQPLHMNAGEDTSRKTELPCYETPQIITYTSEEILEQAGPAQACSPSPCGIF